MSEQLVNDVDKLLCKLPLPTFKDNSTLSANRSGMDISTLVYSALLSEDRYESRCLDSVEIIMKDIIDNSPVFDLQIIGRKGLADRFINKEATVRDFQHYFSGIYRAMERENFYDVAKAGLLSSHILTLYPEKYPEPESKYYSYIVRKIVDLWIKLNLGTTRYHEQRINYNADPGKAKSIVNYLMNHLSTIKIFDDHDWIAHMLHLLRLSFVTIGVSYLPKNNTQNQINSLFRVSHLSTKIKGVGW